MPAQRQLGCAGRLDPSHLQSRITVKGKAHSPRAAARRNAADAAEGEAIDIRLPRRDAIHSHSDAFGHLVWLQRWALHSCTGSLNVTNVMRRLRLHNLKQCGTSDAHEVARQDVLADIEQHVWCLYLYNQ